MDLLEDYVVIVTGSASGIGYATCLAALSEGAYVCGVDVSPSPSLLNEDPKYRGFQGDLTDDSTAQAVVDACTHAFGNRIDGLLNVAGVLDNFASVDGVTDQLWNKCLAVNLTALVKLMRAVIPIMRAQKRGSIVNVSSKAGTSGGSAGVAYTVSKHGLIGVTKNVAWRFKEENIRCNAICPGGVSIHMPDQLKGPRITPEEVARVLIFLVSGLSSRVNGAVIPVDDDWSTI